MGAMVRATPTPRVPSATSVSHRCLVGERRGRRERGRRGRGERKEGEVREEGEERWRGWGERRGEREREEGKGRRGMRRGRRGGGGEGIYRHKITHRKDLRCSNVRSWTYEEASNRAQHKTSDDEWPRRLRTIHMCAVPIILGIK